MVGDELGETERTSCRNDAPAAKSSAPPVAVEGAAAKERMLSAGRRRSSAAEARVLRAMAARLQSYLG